MLEIIDEIRPRKQERATLRGIVMAVYNVIGALCLLFLLALAATWPTNASADTTTMVYSDRQMTLRLLNQPCANTTVLSYLKQEARTRYLASILVWEGRTLQSCWRLTDDKAAVLNVDEEGDGLNPPIPVQVFKADSGV
jgi:hypothetical protein